jgi:hypothetical protein
MFLSKEYEADTDFVFNFNEESYFKIKATLS